MNEAAELPIQDVVLAPPYDGVTAPAGASDPTAQEEALAPHHSIRALVTIPRTPAAAITWGRDQVTKPSQDWLRLCLSFVRQAFGLPAVYPSAIVAWRNAEDQHLVSSGAKVPRGVPVFWSGGTWGHVALSLGDGTCLSNDVVRRGRIDRVRIDDITARWGYGLLGWTEDLNGYDVTPERERTEAQVKNAEDIRAAIRILRRTAERTRPRIARRLRRDIRSLRKTRRAI